jgi:cytochrome P450
MPTLSDWFPLWLQRHPTFVRHAVRVVEAIVPRGAPMGFVTGAKGVHEVFSRPDDFLMGYLNAPKLRLGPFLLGMDPCPQHRDEREYLERTLNQSRVRLAGFLERKSRRWAVRATNLPEGAALELASAYAEPVFIRALARCFGVPVRSAKSEHLRTGDDPGVLALYVRTLGMSIASDHPAPFGLEGLADAVGSEFEQHLATAISLHRAKHAGAPIRSPYIDSDTVIGRMVAQGKSDADIIRWVGGMMSAGAGYPKAFTHALHELIAHRQLGGLYRAALRNDADAVAGYVREALRFRPVFPFLIRYCPRAAVLCDPPPARRHEIAPGSRVKFAPLTAMFDKSLVPRPEAFIPNRPREVYSLFGGKPRACIGEELMMSLFMPMLRELITARPDLLDLRKPGRFRYDGFAVERYVLRGVPRALPAEHGLGAGAASGPQPPPDGHSSPARCPVRDSIDGPISDAPGLEGDVPLDPPPMTASDERSSATGGAPS